MSEITDPALRNVVYANSITERTLYVDEATGDDANAGTSAEPFATFAPAEAQLQRGIANVTRIKAGPGDYEWTPIPPKGYQSFLSIEADEARAGIFNELVADQASDAGTTTTLVKFIGNATDFGGAILEMLTGLDVGERRTIAHNVLDPEDIVPCRPLANIAPGDRFRIFRSNVSLKPTDPDGSDTLKQFGWFGGDLLPTPGGTRDPVPGGVALAFVNLDNSPTFSQHTFGPGFYYLYGVEMLNGADRFVWHGDAIVQCGYTGTRAPLEDIISGIGADKWQGCGVTCQDLNGPFLDSRNARMEGYIRCAGRLSLGRGQTLMLGGHATQAQPNPDGGVLDIFPVPGIGQVLLNSTSDSPAAICSRQGILRMRFNVSLQKASGSQPLVDVKEGGDVLINALVTGEHPDLPGSGTTVRVDSDSRIFCEFGAPALGHASATDWEVVGAAPFNKSALASAGSKVFADGSIASRVS